MVFEFLFSTTKSKASIGHFIDFLQYHAAKKNLEFSQRFCVLKNYNTYSFYVQTQPDNALEFAQYISARLPMSLDFSFVALNTPENLKLRWQNEWKQPPCFPDALEVSQILQKDSKNFCNLTAWVKNIVFEGEKISKISAIKAAFQEMATRLKKNETLYIKTSLGVKELSFVNKSQNVMFWDLSNALTYTRIETAQSHILACYEKPLMPLCPKEVFASTLLQEQNHFECNALLPYDLVLSLLGLFALELDMGYVFIKDSFSKTYDLSYEHYRVPKAREIVVSQDGLIIDRKISKSSKSIFDIIAKHFKDEEPLEVSSQKSAPPKNNQKLIVFLSKKHPTSFWIKDGNSYKTALDISFENNPKLIIEKIRNDYKDGQKLVKNYTQHFQTIIDSIESLSAKSIQSSNLMDIFSSASFVLGYGLDFSLQDASILNNAKKFVRDRGPRIDFKLIKEDENLKLDYPRIIRSSMSFRIAGLDEATLSYGFIDSMAEFLGNFVRDVSVNFNIKNVLLCGDMLGEKIFLDKILHYLPKNIDLTLPKEGYIDY